MKTLHYHTTKNDLGQAALLIQRGQIVAFPTETVYGLGCQIEKSAADKLYQLKQRPHEKSFTLHVSTLDILDQFVEELPHSFYGLKKAFLPGPLTLILPLKKDSLLEKIFPLKTIGIRFPDHLEALQFIQLSGQAVLATSANLHGQPPATDDAMLQAFEEKIAAIIHGGKTRYKTSSTVLSLTPKVKLLREGAIAKEKIEEVLGLNL